MDRNVNLKMELTGFPIALLVFKHIALLPSFNVQDYHHLSNTLAAIKVTFEEMYNITNYNLHYIIFFYGEFVD